MLLATVFVAHAAPVVDREVHFNKVFVDLKILKRWFLSNVPTRTKPA